MPKNTAVFGIFPDRMAVQSAITRLFDAGFDAAEISVLMPEGLGDNEPGNGTNSKKPEVATTGATSGAVLGGVLGWFASIGAIAIPGLGPLLAAGPIMGALAGLGDGGAVDSFSGALVGFGIPEYDAKRYESSVRNGGILLSVHCDDSERTSNAEKVLEQSGGLDVSSTSESSITAAPRNA